MATISDIQAKLDVATAALSKTTSSYQAMVKKYGTDTSTWPPTSNWVVALENLAAARTEVGQLTSLKADFVAKVN